MENNFVKVHSNKDIIISIIVIVAGIAIILVNTMLGIFIILCGLLSFLLYKSGYKYDNKGVKLKKKSLELSRTCQQSVLDFLNGQNMQLNLIHGNEGGTFMLEVWFNKEEKIAYAQASVYQELGYRKITEIVKLNASNAQLLIEKI